MKLNQRLEIRDPTGGIDTDVLAIERFNNSPNHNDLRIVIGDDEWGDDRFVVGPIPFGTTTLAPKFVVTNNGDATVARNLDVSGTVKLNQRLEIRDPTGGIDTDVLAIERFRRGADQNDLRMVIGDNQSGDDRFVVGPIPFETNIFAEKFVVENTGNTSVAGNLRVAGNLKVAGSQNIFRVKTQTLAKHNAGKDSPRSWDFDYSAEQFTEVYEVFVMLQGFSLWDNEDNTTFEPSSKWSHAADATAIPQHVFVRVIDHNTTHAWGEAYASESRADQEADNTILFTVVVMGRVSA